MEIPSWKLSSWLCLENWASTTHCPLSKIETAVAPQLFEFREEAPHSPQKPHVSLKRNKKPMSTEQKPVPDEIETLAPEKS
jgi:hypothetical protein